MEFWDAFTSFFNSEEFGQCAAIAVLVAIYAAVMDFYVRCMDRIWGDEE